MGLLGAFLLVLAQGGGGGAGAADRPPADYEVHEIKAALLLNFARFVEWPSNAFPSATAPIRVGALDRSLDYRQVGELFRSAKPIRGRPIELRPISSDLECRECHILFIPRSERRRSREIIDKLRAFPVLTVGEHEGFLEQGGMINFVAVDGSMRFKIDLYAARRSGLKLHANLLKVAVSVRGQYE